MIEEALAAARKHATPGDPDSVLAALDDFGRNTAFLMNVGDRKGEILDEELRKARPNLALEIGAYCGYSAVRIARLLREWRGRLVSIEVSAECVEVARQMVALAGLSNVVEFRHGAAEDIIPMLSIPFDFVFIDHWKDLYLPDLRRLEDRLLLRPGTVIVADNVTFLGTTDYLEHVRTCGRYDSTYRESTLEYHDDIVDALEVSVFRGAGA